MNTEALRRQLIATRAAIDAALILLSAEEKGGCRHERIHDLTTMGGPVKRVCQDCGEVLIDESKGEG